MWEWLNCMHVDTSEGGAVMSRCGFRSVRYLEVLQKRFGTKDSVRCSEFGGCRFSEVANVLQVWDFQSVTRALSALGSVVRFSECPLLGVSAQGGSTVVPCPNPGILVWVPACRACPCSSINIDYTLQLSSQLFHIYFPNVLSIP